MGRGRRSPRRLYPARNSGRGRGHVSCGPRSRRSGSTLESLIGLAGSAALAWVDSFGWNACVLYIAAALIAAAAPWFRFVIEE